jgi:CHAD domain-containing protein
MKREHPTSFRVYGFEALRERLPPIRQELDGARRAEDVEFVHRLRVASRRARNALALFATSLPQKLAQSWRKELRRITRSLGAARDLDVQAEWVERVLDRTHDPELRPGIARLLLRLRQRRARRQTDVVRVIDRLERRRTLDGMAAVLHELIVHARVYEHDTLPEDLVPRAADAILLRLEELLAFEPFLALPERVTELHEMRIAAKHLRYTLEIFAPLWPGTLKPALHAAKDLQELLGDIHDSDVWLLFLPQFLQDERALTHEYFGDDRPARELVAGIEALEAERGAQRRRRWDALQGCWDDLSGRNVWGELRHVLRGAATDRNGGRQADADSTAENSPQRDPDSSAEDRPGDGSA